jgi:hypothetical protein
VASIAPFFPAPQEWNQCSGNYFSVFVETSDSAGPQGLSKIGFHGILPHPLPSVSLALSHITVTVETSGHSLTVRV